MLILFDVDGTLISTGGAGIRAMHMAGRELFGSRFGVDGVEFAGRLDPLIIADLLSVHGVEPTAEAVLEFRDGYRRFLGEVLAQNGSNRALPGVLDVVEALAGRSGVTLGLLTGNYEDTGCVKLEACGIDVRHFTIRVWGDHSPHSPPARNHLPPLAMERYREARDEPVSPDRVWIIGDTPHDVACAQQNGCRSLAVATGRYDAPALSAAEPDAVLPDLSDLASVLQIVGLD